MEEVEGRERYVSTDVMGAVYNRGKRSLSVVAQMSFSFEKKRWERITMDVRRRMKKEVYWVAARGGAGDVIFRQCGEVQSGGGRGGSSSALLRVFFGGGQDLLRLVCGRINDTKNLMVKIRFFQILSINSDSERN